MIKNLIRLILCMGLVGLLTHTASAQWVQIDNNRFLGSPEMCLVVSNGNIFAGTLGLGVFRCTENDTNWTAANNGITNHAVQALAVSGNNIFAGTYQGGGVFLSTNNGTSWTLVDSGLTYKSVHSLAASGSIIFAGTENGKVFLSTNSGTSWTEADSGFTGEPVYSFAFSGGNVFAGTYGMGVYRSSNNGATWTPVNSGLPASNIWHLAVSGSNLFAGTEVGGVFLSTNNGASWTAVNNGLTGYALAVTCLAVSGSNLFAGASNRVFLSTNNGTSWAGCNSGLPMDVDGLAVGESYIFASVTAHAAHQIWRLPLSEIVGIINDKPQQGILKPNAGGFKINISKNGITILSPENLNNGAITVGLFTISGKRIYSATHQAYNGTLSLPVSGLSTGAYLMSIRGNTITLSSPFVVTK
jgi:hypothetical protein